METEFLEELVQKIDDMIVQHDYPGFEARALKLGLPEWARNLPAKTYSKCLKHESVFVRLAALRWFQEAPGKIKPHIELIYRSLEDSDPFVRLEAICCLETLRQADDEMIEKLAALADDNDIDVQRGLAKALGKLTLRTTKNARNNACALQALDKLCQSKDPQLRLKALKAIRKIQEK
jgi:HEAT repeat protein